MDLPFTKEQFLGVFADYNRAMWPMPIVWNAVALLVVALSFSKIPYRTVLPVLLGFIWMWMGAVYHLCYFSAINKAAYLFGCLFVVQAALFIHAGVFRGDLAIQFKPTLRGWLGAMLVLYAMVIYPLLGLAFGHQYPAAPTFGLPCPTTIFTLGLLMWSTRRPHWWMMVIPL